MRPKVSVFENPEKQSVWYRGYVESFDGRIKDKTYCVNVYPNRLKALESAKRLITKLKKWKQKL